MAPLFVGLIPDPLAPGYVAVLRRDGALLMVAQEGGHAVLDEEFLALDLLLFEFVLLRGRLSVLQFAEPSLASLVLVEKMAVRVVRLNQLLLQVFTIRVEQTSSFSRIWESLSCTMADCPMSGRLRVVGSWR